MLLYLSTHQAAGHQNAGPWLGPSGPVCPPLCLLGDRPLSARSCRAGTAHTRPGSYDTPTPDGMRMEGGPHSGYGARRGSFAPFQVPLSDEPGRVPTREGVLRANGAGPAGLGAGARMQSLQLQTCPGLHETPPTPGSGASSGAASVWTLRGGFNEAPGGRGPVWGPCSALGHMRWTGLWLMLLFR